MGEVLSDLLSNEYITPQVHTYFEQKLLIGNSRSTLIFWISFYLFIYCYLVQNTTATEEERKMKLFFLVINKKYCNFTLFGIMTGYDSDSEAKDVDVEEKVLRREALVSA